MLNKTRLILLLIIFVLFNSSNSIENPQRADTTYVYYKGMQSEVRHLRGGLAIGGFTNKKYNLEFISWKKISYEKRKSLYSYIERNDIWNMSDIYHNKVVVLGGFSYQFVLSDSDELKYKTIYLSNCYNEKLDSLRYYLFELVPPKFKKKYKLEYYSYEKEDPCACSIKDK
jgi:hypothetical protein